MWQEILLALGVGLGTGLAAGFGGARYLKNKKAPAGLDEWEQLEREAEKKRRAYIDDKGK